MRRRRSARRDSRSSRWPIPLAVGIIVLSGWTIPAVSFTTAGMDRAASTDVVDDPSGAVGLDVAGSVRKDRVDPLVNVSNRFGTQLTVTVSLQDGTAGDLSLTADGTTTADEVTFSIDSGTTETVYLQANDVGDTVYFDVTARSIDSSVDAWDRSTYVDNPGGGAPPGDGGPPDGGGPGG